MLTGAYTMVEWSFDEHYPSRRDAVLDMAKVIRREVEELVKAGAKYIQIDEPAIHTRPDEDFDLASRRCTSPWTASTPSSTPTSATARSRRSTPDMIKLPVKQIHLAFKNTDFAYLDLMQQHGFRRRTRTSASASPTSTRASSKTSRTSRTASAAPSSCCRRSASGSTRLRPQDSHDGGAEAKLQVMADAVRDIKRELELE